MSASALIVLLFGWQTLSTGYSMSLIGYEQACVAQGAATQPGSPADSGVFTPAGFVLGTVMGTLVVLSVLFLCREDRWWWLLCCRPRPHRPHSLPGQAGEICRLNGVDLLLLLVSLP